ncbi:MAG: hypothetical protein LBT24_05215, partial [Tannerella sp.]|nr:hypothetical protein [Tannerella sp.]
SKARSFIACNLLHSVLDKGNAGLIVENCSFKHCVADSEAKIIDTKNNVVSIKECSGLENVNREGDKATDATVSYANSEGDPIGARLDDTTVGVS